MTKTKHPSNRYERLRIKEIKDAKSNGQSSRLWRKTRETETVKELEDEIFTEQIRLSKENTGKEPVERLNHI